MTHPNLAADAADIARELNELPAQQQQALQALCEAIAEVRSGEQQLVAIFLIEKADLLGDKPVTLWSCVKKNSDLIRFIRYAADRLEKKAA